MRQYNATVSLITWFGLLYCLALLVAWVVLLFVENGNFQDCLDAHADDEGKCREEKKAVEIMGLYPLIIDLVVIFQPVTLFVYMRKIRHTKVSLLDELRQSYKQR